MKSFTNEVLNWWNFKHPENITSGAMEFFAVTNLNQHTFALSVILLITRCYIHLARIKSETPRFNVFVVLLETKISLQRKTVSLQRKTAIKTGDLKD